MAFPAQISALESMHIPPVLPGPDRLLLVMHGLGDSMDGYRFLPDLLKIPGLHYLLVNAPDSYFMGFSWFELNENLGEGVERSRELLFNTLDELQAQGWSASQIGVFGFSQGALMALDLAARYPKTLGPVVAVSGFCAFLEQYPEAFSPVVRTQKILATHGTKDQMLSYVESRAQIQRLSGMGLPVKWKEYRKEHTIDPEEEVADIRKFLVDNFAR